ncbi:hypothetical protein [Planktothrix pseudagardhii]|uniref:Uncharacterized protein n=1 Tax=Planktothrix pseudagardhii TaxID=132604 RepID=A0A9W4CGV1_9CYAN|nr:hypothetical protein [Planktothrix pseudagardhii]CAD5931205.1 hypothetical protein NO713_01299 [Planktothrix pseudagardhii]
MNQNSNSSVVPDVNLSQNQLDFQAQGFNQRLTQTLTITNSVPKTLLQGKWNIIPHPSDPIIEDGKHPWIEIKPQRFQKNQVVCSITVETNLLKANQVYERQLNLKTNSNPQNYQIPLTVKTALLPVLLGKKFYILLGITFLILIVALTPAYTYLSFATTFSTPQFRHHPGFSQILVDLFWKGLSLLTAIIWLYLGIRIGLSRRGGLWVIPSAFLSYFLLILMVQLIGMLSAIVIPSGSDSPLSLLFQDGGKCGRILSRMLISVLGGGSVLNMGVVWGWLTQRYQKIGFEPKESNILAFLIILSSFSWGVVFFIKWLLPVMILTGILSLVGIFKLIQTSVKKRQKVIQAYFQSESQRIPE